MKARPNAAIGFILATVTLDLLAMSVVIPVLPSLIKSFVGGNSVAAAHAIGLFGTGWALMQFVFSPVQGALSDRFGRRPVILLSNLGLALDFLLMAVAPTLSWLFVGRLISGITAASFSTAGAYIADITPPERRAARFGLMSVAFGFGFIIGPALGGVLGSYGARLPFWVSAGLAFTNFLFGVFVLPESLPLDRRAVWSWRRANPVGALNLFRSRPGLLGLGGVTLLTLLAQNVLPTITVLYAGDRYHFDQRSLGYMLASLGIGGAVVGAGLTGPVVRALGERRTLLLGLACGVVGYALMGLASTGAMFLASLPIVCLRGFAEPALGGLRTRYVSPSEQGRLAGATSSLLGIAGLFGPSLYTESYAASLTAGGAWHLPGAPYYISATMLILALTLAYRTARPPAAA